MRDKLLINLSTLNVFLSIVGYQLIMVIFSNNMEAEGASQIITVPYRAISVIIPFLVIIINYKESYKLGRIVKILWFYWFLLFIRFIYDFYIKTYVQVDHADIIKTFLFMGPMTLLPMFAVMKSINYIDINKLFKWTFIATSLSVIIIFLKQGLGIYTNEYSRMQASMALGSLGTGQLGLMGIIMCFSYLYLFKEINFIKKTFVYLIVFISALILLRAASRGPLLIGIVLFFIIIFSKIKNKFISFSFISFLVLILYLAYDFILEIVGNISPMLVARLVSASGNQFGTRSTFYHNAINTFLDHPFTGGAFGHYSDNVIMYTHNAFLDSIMQLGIIGLIIVYLYLFPIKKTMQFISSKDFRLWIGLILTQSMISTMLSSSFYYSYEISILITYLFTYSRSFSKSKE